MADLKKARDIKDDWTGITDPQLRRKIQNRLKVRAYRKHIPLIASYIHCKSSKLVLLDQRGNGAVWEFSSFTIFFIMFHEVRTIYLNSE